MGLPTFHIQPCVEGSARRENVQGCRRKCNSKKNYNYRRKRKYKNKRKEIKYG